MATAKELITWAASQIGTKETPPGSGKVKYWDAYKKRCGVNYNGQPWCAAFVADGMCTVGLWKQTKDEGRFRYCPSLVNWGKANGTWVDRSKGAKPGDIVLFGSYGTACHVGFVEKVVSSTRLQTIEGNTSVSSNDNGGSVMRRTRDYGTLGSGWYVMGFVRPKFSAASTTTTKPATSASTTSKPVTSTETKPASSASVSTSKSTQYVVQVNNLQVRKSAGTDGTKTGKVYNKGRKVDVVSTKKVGSDTWGKTKDGWFAIKYKGKTYAKKVATSTKYKITVKAGVNIRKGAGTKYAKITGKKTAYAKGETVTVKATKTVDGNLWGQTSLGWFAIKYGKETYATKA